MMWPLAVLAVAGVVPPPTNPDDVPTGTCDIVSVAFTKDDEDVVTGATLIVKCATSDGATRLFETPVTPDSVELDLLRLLVVVLDRLPGEPGEIVVQ